MVKRERILARFFFVLKNFSKIYFLDEDKIKNKMTARLRSKNERMMLDLLDQIKNLPTDLSSDEFDSLQVILKSKQFVSLVIKTVLRNWTQVHPIQVMNRSCQTAWLRCWRYRARQRTGPYVVEAVKRMNTSGYRVQSLMR